MERGRARERRSAPAEPAIQRRTGPAVTRGAFLMIRRLALPVGCTALCLAVFATVRAQAPAPATAAAPATTTTAPTTISVEAAVIGTSTPPIAAPRGATVL